MVRPVTNFHRDRAGTSLKLPGPGFAEDYQDRDREQPGPGFAEDYQDRDPGRSLVTELYDDFVLFLYKFNL